MSVHLCICVRVSVSDSVSSRYVFLVPFGCMVQRVTSNAAVAGLTHARDGRLEFRDICSKKGAIQSEVQGALIDVQGQHPEPSRGRGLKSKPHKRMKKKRKKNAIKKKMPSKKTRRRGWPTKP